MFVSKLNFNPLEELGPKLDIPPSAYLQDIKKRKILLSDEEVAFAIKQPFYRIIPIFGTNLFKLIIVRMTDIDLYYSEDKIFEVKKSSDGYYINCETLNYLNWNHFIKSIPNMEGVIPAPQNRYDRAVRSTNRQRIKERKTEEGRKRQALKEYIGNNPSFGIEEI